MKEIRFSDEQIAFRLRKTIPIEQAIREKGLFGNQSSAAKPRDKKWQHTLERLAIVFGEPLN